MNIHEKYVVYELNNIMGNERHKSLEKVGFSGFKQNNFETEKDAIQALIDDEKTYEDYVILKQVYIN
jgi:hypothetical protein